MAGYLATAHRSLPELHDPYHFEKISTRAGGVGRPRPSRVSPRRHSGFWTSPGGQAGAHARRRHCPQVEAPGQFARILLDFSSERSPVA